MLIAVGAIGLWVLWPMPVSAQDVIVLANGDRLNGEIKELDRGDLWFNPEYAEAVFVIDWAQVVEIDSTRRFAFQLSDGRRFIGSCRSDPSAPGTLIITEAGGDTPVSAQSVISMRAVDADILGRLSVDIAFGYSFARANTNHQLTLRSSAVYLEEAWELRASGDTLQNRVDDGADTLRTNSTVGYTRFLRGQWFAIGAAGFLQNEEQSLDLRSTIVAGVGRFLRRTQWFDSRLIFGGGWTSEKFLDDEDSRFNSAEGLLGLMFDAFDVGDLVFKTVALVYPSLSDMGRVRIDFDVDMKWELISDLFWSTGYFHNYDSEPRAETSKNDFGVTTTFGWSF